MSNDTKSSGEMCDCVFDPNTFQCKMCGASSSDKCISSVEPEREKSCEIQQDDIGNVSGDHQDDTSNKRNDGKSVEANTNSAEKETQKISEIPVDKVDRVLTNVEDHKDDTGNVKNNDTSESTDASKIDAALCEAGGGKHEDTHIEDDDDLHDDDNDDDLHDDDDDDDLHDDDDDDAVCEDIFKNKEITMLITEPNAICDENNKMDCTEKLIVSESAGTNDEKSLASFPKEPTQSSDDKSINVGATNLSGEDTTPQELKIQSEHNELPDLTTAGSKPSDNSTVINVANELSNKPSGVMTTCKESEPELLPFTALVAKVASKSVLKQKVKTSANHGAALCDHTSLVAKERPFKRRKLAPLTPECLEPFKKGWKRELVFRATQDETKKRSADVYYYTPSKVKLRSGIQIEDYLRKHEEHKLGPECFTFRKCCIYEPPMETVRFAKQTRNRQEGVVKNTNQSNGTLKVVHRPGPQKAGNMITNLAKKRPKKILLSKKLTQMINLRWPRQKFRKWKDYAEEKTCSLNCPGQIGVLPSLHCRVCLCLFHPSCIGVKDELQPFTCNKCVVEGRDSEVHHAPLDPPLPSPPKIKVISHSSSSALPKLTVKPTALSRIIADGVSLQPPPLKKAPGAATTPGNGENVNAPVKASTWMPPCGIPLPRQPPPLRLGTQGPGPSSLIKGQLTRPPPPLVARPQKLLVASFNSSPNLSVTPTSHAVSSLGKLNPLSNLKLKTYARNPRILSLPSGKMNVKLPRSIETTVKTMKFVLKTNVGETVEVVVPFVTPTTESGPPQPEYIVVNKQGQSTGLMVRLGSRVVQLPILSQTTRTIPLMNNKVIPYQPNKVKNPPEMIVIDDDGGKNKEKEVSHAKEVTNHVPNAAPNVVLAETPLMPNLSPAITVNQDPVPICKDTNLMIRSDPTFPRVAAKKPRTHAENVNPVKCSIQWLHGGVTSLTKIFEYLHQGDLSRASQVCRTWNLLATQSHLWLCVNLDGFLVYDWEGLVRKMIIQRSFRLDMRRMLTFEDRNRTWHGFAAVLDDLRHLTHIDFGPVPVSILHTVANTLQNLEVLTAEWVTDICRDKKQPEGSCRLDVGKFGQLPTLRTLRLRGVHGIQILGSATNRVLSDLERLQKLTHLSLTSLKDVPAVELGFVKSLRSLTILELGDCLDWTYRMYENIQSLQRLKKLRLECSNVKGNFALSNALCQMPVLQHVELYHFHLDETILQTFEKMSCLQWLSLWPNHKQQLQYSSVNTSVLQNIRKCVRLKAFVWGVLTLDTSPSNEDDNGNLKPSGLDIIELSDDDDKDAASKLLSDNKECIPFALSELISEDKNESPQELLSLVQLQCRVHKLLPKTVRSIQPTRVKNSWELSHVNGGIQH